MSETIEIPEGLYPMRVVTRMTGLSADTIRAWERRYGVVAPHRTDGNARRYSAEQVRRLALLRQATEHGHCIGDLIGLPEEGLRELVRGDGAAAPQPLGGSWCDRVVDSYLAAIQAYDTRRAADLLGRSAAMLSPRDVLFELVLPAIHQLGERRSRGSLRVAHERIASNQLQGLLRAMLRLSAVQAGAPRIVVATPEGHQHELGALVGAFVAAMHGIDPIYLGASVPREELAAAMTGSGAYLLLLSIVRDLAPAERAATGGLLTDLGHSFEVWVGTPEGHEATRLGSGVRFFHRFEDLEAALTHAQGRARGPTGRSG